MVEFKSRIYREENDQIIGAEVTVYSEEGDNIGSIQITSKQDFDDLIERIDGFDDVFVSRNELAQLVNQLTINAATLDDYSSSDFALRDHSHSLEYAQIQHANSDSVNGLGSSNLYGHVKLVDGLNQSSYHDGFALSASQGKVLNDKINNVVKDTRTWTKVRDSELLSLWYNSNLKMCYCLYNRDNYTGFKNASNVNKEIELHGTTAIPEAYRPPSRVTCSLYRPDVSVNIERTGSIKAYSLTQLSSINLHCSFWWVIL